MQQAIEPHPLADYGHHRLPHWLWRRSQIAHDIVARTRDAWLVLTGRCSLHQAWQRGLNDGSRAEYQRIIVNGGDIAGKVWSREHKRLVPDNRQMLVLPMTAQPGNQHDPLS